MMTNVCQNAVVYTTIDFLYNLFTYIGHSAMEKKVKYDNQNIIISEVSLNLNWYV